MIKGFAHICFTVNDLDSAIAFYQDKLGFRHAFDFINESDRGFTLMGGGNLQCRQSPGSRSPIRERQFHIVLCSSEADKCIERQALTTSQA